MSIKKPKKLIEKNGKKYKLNNEALNRRLNKGGIERELDAIYNAKTIPASRDAIKKWMKIGYGTDNIEALEAIAEYYDTSVEEFLTETDEVWEYYEKAKNIDKKRALQASLHTIRTSIIESADDEPGYVARHGIRGLIDSVPRGIGVILLFGFYGTWLCTLDTRTQMIIGPAVMPIILEYFSFFSSEYFPKQNIYRKICHYIKRILEIFYLGQMAVSILHFYHILF